MEVMPDGTHGGPQAGAGVPGYLPRIWRAPSHSFLGSRSPFLASWIIALATTVVSGSPRSTGPSRISAASNAAVKLAMSSGPNAWSFSRIARIGTSSPGIARRTQEVTPFTSAVWAIGDSTPTKSNQDKEFGIKDAVSPIGGQKRKTPAEWPGRGPETRSHSGRGDAAAGPAIPIRSRLLGSVRHRVFI